MLDIRLADLQCTNEGLHIVRVGSGDRVSYISTNDHASASRTYADALDRVLSAIPEIQDAQKTIS